jgi:two-component system osmolarity sensor histidine kinase EnvZ
LFHPSVGLVGRILAIVLLTILVEFVAGTVLYDRASSLRVREDEAHRVAEHLAAASNIIMQGKPADRPALAVRFSSKYFTVRWGLAPPLVPPMSADLFEMRAQILAWEPSLANHGLQLFLKEPGRHSVVMGSLRIADGSWLIFKAPQLVDEGKFRFAWIGMMVVVATSLALIALLMIRWTLRPLRRLSAAAGRIGHGEQEPIPEMGGDEVRGLIRAFNEMQGRIHSLIEDRTEALAAVGHDLRTPLSRIQLRANEIADAPLRQAITGDIREMGGMVSSLLAYLGGDNDPERPQSCDLAVMAETLADEIVDMGGKARYSGPDHLEYAVRPIGFKRALRNIVENAAKYGDRVVVTVRDDEGGVSIVVEDDGPGIAPDRMEDVLRPFVRLDPARGRDTRGLGLGLAIAARAIEREGGTIALSNRAEGGLSVHIRLPRRDEMPPQT